MNTQITQYIRQGAVALPLAAILFLTGLLFRGQPADDPRSLTFDPTHFAQPSPPPDTALAGRS